MLSLRCPLGDELTSLAEVSGALHGAITSQLESEGNAAVAGAIRSHSVRIEYLASLQSAPAAMTEEDFDLAVLRSSKAIKVTLQPFLD